MGYRIERRARRIVAAATTTVKGHVPHVLPAAERGQSMVEYGIVVAPIAIVAFVAIQALGQHIVAMFEHILRNIQGLGPTAGN
jgi:Flp pilus assembly pilin Flp